MSGGILLWLIKTDKTIFSKLRLNVILIKRTFLEKIEYYNNDVAACYKKQKC